jgi:hypothetical protein
MKELCWGKKPHFFDLPSAPFTWRLGEGFRTTEIRVEPPMTNSNQKCEYNLRIINMKEGHSATTGYYVNPSDFVNVYQQPVPVNGYDIW